MIGYEVHERFLILISFSTWHRLCVACLKLQVVHEKYADEARASVAAAGGQYKSRSLLLCYVVKLSHECVSSFYDTYVISGIITICCVTFFMVGYILGN